MSGPLSVSFPVQLPYNYNQLEGRFKQLQGKCACCEESSEFLLAGVVRMSIIFTADCTLSQRQSIFPKHLPPGVKMKDP